MYSSKQMLTHAHYDISLRAVVQELDFYYFMCVCVCKKTPCLLIREKQNQSMISFMSVHSAAPSYYVLSSPTRS